MFPLPRRIFSVRCNHQTAQPTRTSRSSIAWATRSPSSRRISRRRPVRLLDLIREFDARRGWQRMGSAPAPSGWRGA